MIWAEIRFFVSREFDSPDAPGSGVNMSLDFVRKLDRLREAVKIPLKVHSGYRTEAHNGKVGGVDSSAHTSGHAADIAAFAYSTKYKIVAEAMRLGFRRIGVGTSFIHLDDDITKPQDVLWSYPTLAKRNAPAIPPANTDGFVA